MSAAPKTMPFGKHRGERIADLPDDYLDWLLSIELRAPLRGAVAAEAARRDAKHEARRKTARVRGGLASPQVAEAAREIVKRGFKAAALVAHPDRDGGDTRAMQRLVDAREALEAAIVTNASSIFEAA